MKLLNQALDVRLHLRLLPSKQVVEVEVVPDDELVAVEGRHRLLRVKDSLLVDVRDQSFGSDAFIDEALVDCYHSIQNHAPAFEVFFFLSRQHLSHEKLYSWNTDAPVVVNFGDYAVSTLAGWHIEDWKLRSDYA